MIVHQCPKRSILLEVGLGKDPTNRTICEKSDRTDLVTIFHPSFGILGMGVRKLISLFLYCVV